MISRRNIRIKVMQSLYSAETGTPVDANNNLDKIKKSAAIQLDEEINNAAVTFALCLLYLVKITEYVETEARIKAGKYLPTEADKNVSVKLASNYLVEKLKQSASFTTFVEKHNVAELIEDAFVQKAFNNLKSSESYERYIANPEHDKNEDADILRYIWEVEIVTNESFEGYLSDEVDNWDDDAEMITILMDNFFTRRKIGHFDEFISKEKNEFAHNLLRTVIEKDEYLNSLIVPKLKNWEADRIASVDMLCIKMGLVEFLYFPTIPTKATINEYIEISKNYSTKQSSQFVNGVLDKLLKELLAENKIRKIESSSTK